MQLLPIISGLLLGVIANVIADWLIKRRGLEPSRFALYRRGLFSALGIVVVGALWAIPEMQSHYGLWQTYLVILYFFIVAIIDLEHRLIMHSVSLAGGVLAVILGWQAHGMAETLIGGATGFGIVFGLYLLGWLFVVFQRKVRNKIIDEVAFGWGDVILATVLGLLLGFPLIVMAIFLAIVFASVYSLFHIAYLVVRRRYHSGAVIPLGPFFVLGAFFVGFLQVAAQMMLANIFPLILSIP